MDVILFLIFALISVVCAINVVVQTHPISSALSLVGVMGSLAVLYLLLGAEFIAAAQVIVYAGAIMVLFIFVFPSPSLFIFVPFHSSFKSLTIKFSLLFIRRHRRHRFR